MVAPRWPGGRRAREVVLDLWVLVPVVVLGWPLLTRSGYPFARDLVLTPRLPLRPETVGLGTASPRAAPLDAVVGVLSLGLDGGVVGRVAVLGGLALAGWGAHRLARPLGHPPACSSAPSRCGTRSSSSAWASGSGRCSSATRPSGGSPSRRCGRTRTAVSSHGRRPGWRSAP